MLSVIKINQILKIEDFTHAHRKKKFHKNNLFFTKMGAGTCAQMTYPSLSQFLGRRLIDAKEL